MKRLIIADVKSHHFNGKCIGHYFAVAENYLNIFKDKIQILIAGGPIFKQKFGSDQMLDLPYSVDVLHDNIFKKKFKTLANCKSLFMQAKGDTIILQQSSVITSFIGVLLFYHHKSKLYMIQYNNDAMNNRIGKIIYAMMKNKIDGIICPNDQVGKAWKRPYCIVTDYINVQTNVNYVPFEKRRYDFCFVGRIVEGKGVEAAVRYISGTQYTLLIAGKAEGDLHEKISKICAHCPNIKFIDEVLPQSEYLRLIKISKYGLLNYEEEYQKRSSGVVLDFLMNGTPVIGKKCSALVMIQKYGAGELYDDISEIENMDLLNPNHYAKLLHGIDFFNDANRKLAVKLANFLGIRY
jgi:glycosyltransferase involved in cell wall biosynthesis